MPVQRGALEGVGKAYIFAKFAQAVFMLYEPFIAFSPGSSGGGSRSASATSTKRSRSLASEAAEDSDMEKEAEWYERNVRRGLWSCEGSEDDEDGVERGRPRKRRKRDSGSEHTVDTLPSLTESFAVGVSCTDSNRGSQEDAGLLQVPSEPHDWSGTDKHPPQGSLANEDREQESV
ncbi:hypothetical protein VM1G_09898 [Cytospora mali]|uniref:Uncharacterized protein n=1 Tax=Cytospora mali TaxID=578113 RepID=A0A194WDW2_CYTMA|nr:hypothetical protein VM1G_09898 [Valsa mali]